MSVVQPSSMSAPRAAVVPSSPSPRAMITIRPYRSAMWWPCHGVPTSLVSATTGPEISRSTSRMTTKNIQPVVRSASSSRIQPTCVTSKVPAMTLQTSRRSGSSLLARNHWNSIGTRMIT